MTTPRPLSARCDPSGSGYSLFQGPHLFPINGGNTNLFPLMQGRLVFVLNLCIWLLIL